MGIQKKSFLFQDNRNMQHFSHSCSRQCSGKQNQLIPFPFPTKGKKKKQIQLPSLIDPAGHQVALRKLSNGLSVRNRGVHRCSGKKGSQSIRFLYIPTYWQTVFCWSGNGRCSGVWKCEVHFIQISSDYWLHYDLETKCGGGR